MSPSDKLRALLDGAGIEYGSGFGGDTLWTGRDGIEWRWDKQENILAMYSHTITPEQAIAATVGTRTDLANRLREVHGLHAFAELFGFSWEDESDWDWHDVACAMADAIDATAGTAVTLDEATERIEKFMGDYAKLLLESTLYVERDEPTDQHALDVAERKEAQMARDLAEALATVGVGTCQIETTESWLPAERYHRCKHCGAFFAVLNASHDIPPRVCPNCGRRITEEDE